MIKSSAVVIWGLAILQCKKREGVGEEIDEEVEEEEPLQVAVDWKKHHIGHDAFRPTEIPEEKSG